MIGENSCRMADGESGFAFRNADGALEREDDQTAMEAGQQRGWPCGVITDLDRQNASRREIKHLLELFRLRIDSLECPRDLSAGVENCRLADVLRQRLAPGFQQSVSFHFGSRAVQGSMNSPGLRWKKGGMFRPSEESIPCAVRQSEITSLLLF